MTLQHDRVSPRLLKRVFVRCFVRSVIAKAGCSSERGASGKSSQTCAPHGTTALVSWEIPQLCIMRRDARYPRHPTSRVNARRCKGQRRACPWGQGRSHVASYLLFLAHPSEPRRRIRSYHIHPNGTHSVFFDSFFFHFLELPLIPNHLLRQSQLTSAYTANMDMGSSSMASMASTATSMAMGTSTGMAMGTSTGMAAMASSTGSAHGSMDMGGMDMGGSCKISVSDDESPRRRSNC